MPYLQLELKPPRRPRPARSRRGAKLLERWSPEPSEASPTEILSDRGALWLVNERFGELRIHSAPGRLTGWPAPGLDAGEFEEQLTLDWLPAIYPVWGWQVLHASAAVEESTGRAVAFSGAAEAGKSTFGFALGRRSGWQQFADDLLPFRRSDGVIELIPLRNEARLRPPSAEFFDRVPWERTALEWPSREPSLTSIFFLERAARLEETSEISRMTGGLAYQRLLEQSFTLSLSDSKVRSRLMEDYLCLAAEVPVFLLRYRPQLESLDPVLDGVLETARELPHADTGSDSTSAER